MKILFVHNKYPAQFVHMARALVQQGHEVVFVSEFVSPLHTISGLQLIRLQIPPVEKQSDKSLQAYLTCLKRSNIFSNAFMQLRQKGFSPDLIVDHPAWGGSCYVSDIFPQAARLCYLEWFFTKATQSVFTGQDYAANPVLFAVQRQRNLFTLNALHDADWGLVPTQWQCRQFPANYHYKMQVVHDGIDTGFFCPAPRDNNKPLQIHDVQGTVIVNVPAGTELVTYATRGLEPHRGFPQLYDALPRILEARPLCHVLIVADDHVNYGDPRPDGKGWGQYLRESKPLPEQLAARVHYLPFQPVEVYRRLVQLSTVHVYLTVPFVLSWSLLEAMSCGCLVVASDTEPLREVVQHGVNGFLTPWNDVEALADSVIQALEYAPHVQAMRQAARDGVVQRYDLGMVLSQQLRILTDVVCRKRSGVS